MKKIPKLAKSCRGLPRGEYQSLMAAIRTGRPVDVAGTDRVVRTIREAESLGLLLPKQRPGRKQKTLKLHVLVKKGKSS
ncbi:MAG: hypothetical protein SGI77_24985 [Pirellulaceae bacterium]|nr:hypothetical protein [Pirellulaceae bacterium]